MKNFGKKDIFALTLVCQIICVAFVFFNNLKTTHKGSQRDAQENTSTSVYTEDLMEENKPAWKIRKACRDPSLRILYFVYTAPKNNEKRRWIRKTIGDPNIASEMNSAISFFVGEAADMNDIEAILDEALSEGDIAVLNFTDTYRNLSYKFLQGAKWVSDNCLLDHRATLIKVDDDVLGASAPCHEVRDEEHAGSPSGQKSWCQSAARKRFGSSKHRR
ncbi:hypothetical protein HPB50_006405 [Hyalomma asiaticum]|uniref:Uncharacterized protein n=1 Tax=Hyalomma asiaticum TaxID=266040 RepID=A0ACB7SH74_HYAAI|nr:hypothetical protein HPB50_006405 [Hyalomma asiaticum]